MFVGGGAAQDAGQVAAHAGRHGGIAEIAFDNAIVEGGDVANGAVGVEVWAVPFEGIVLTAEGDFGGIMRIDRAFGAIYPAHDVVGAEPDLFRAEANGGVVGEKENGREIIPAIASERSGPAAGG